MEINCVSQVQSVQKLRFVSHSQPTQRSPHSPPLFFFFFNWNSLPKKMRIQSLSTQPPRAAGQSGEVL